MNTRFIRLSFIYIQLLLLCCACSNKNEGKLNDRKKMDSVKGTLSNHIDTSSIRIFASLAYKNDNYKEAIDLFGQLIEVFPHKGEYYATRGYCLTQLNSDSAAIKDFLKSVEYNFNIFEAYRSLGITYMFKLDDPKLARFYFGKCFEINPKDEEIIKYLKALNDGTPNNL